jgi:hypothetical protein
MMDPEPMMGSADMTLTSFAHELFLMKSPFAGAAVECYRKVLAYGIRPTIALAFHAHEGGGAGSVVDNNLNWGAVRTPEDPNLAAGTTDGPKGPFVVYTDPVKSVEDWCKRIRGPKYINAPVSFDTVEQVCLRYAPFSDRNNPWAYAVAVGRMSQKWRETVSNFFFTETGFAVDAQLVDFWQECGGVGHPNESGSWLPGIGFPISNMMDAPDGDGSIQWFERGVLGVRKTGAHRWLRLQEHAGWERPDLAK